MKRLLCWLALVWLSCGGASAEDLVIQALDDQGNLTFSTISNAQSYRIEWAPADGSPWTNFQAAAEMLDEIAATANPSITVEVPVQYRVVASVTNPPPPEYVVIDLSAGPSASSYPVSSLSAVPPGGWTDEYKTTKLVLRLIPAGTFTMGSPPGELGQNPTNEVQHTVTLTKDFYIGVFEVTQRQWERVMGNWPSYFTNETYRESRPVELLSYYDIRENPANTAINPNWPASSQVHADSFMGKLRAKTGLTTLDLPTESQWEYACRAGTTTALNSGYNLTYLANDLRMGDVGRYFYNSGASSPLPRSSTTAGTAKVGLYLPNASGLYDMHGNVYEWCLDWFGAYPGTVTDPVGSAAASNRVQRGGCWMYYAASCRSALRDSRFTPNTRHNYGGFRLARTLP